MPVQNIGNDNIETTFNKGIKTEWWSACVTNAGKCDYVVHMFLCKLLSKKEFEPRYKFKYSHNTFFTHTVSVHRI